MHKKLGLESKNQITPREIEPLVTLRPEFITSLAEQTMGVILLQLSHDLARYYLNPTKLDTFFTPNIDLIESVMNVEQLATELAKTIARDISETQVSVADAVPSLEEFFWTEARKIHAEQRANTQQARVVQSLESIYQTLVYDNELAKPIIDSRTQARESAVRAQEQRLLEIEQALKVIFDYHTNRYLAKKIGGGKKTDQFYEAEHLAAIKLIMKDESVLYTLLEHNAEQNHQTLGSIAATWFAQQVEFIRSLPIGSLMPIIPDNMAGLEVDGPFQLLDNNLDFTSLNDEQLSVLTEQLWNLGLESGTDELTLSNMSLTEATNLAVQQFLAERKRMALPFLFSLTSDLQIAIFLMELERIANR